jgi:predicted 2-oxoglutarate/Fe(II)-dependent dioxygenase YbiX
LSCPGLGFHADGATRTCNVALSDDDPAGGGRLVDVAGGAVAALPRRAGDATLHDSTLLHAVTAVRPGAARYSLILFFFRRAPR